MAAIILSFFSICTVQPQFSLPVDTLEASRRTHPVVRTQTACQLVVRGFKLRVGGSVALLQAAHDLLHDGLDLPEGFCPESTSH
jgi:hypothetical protein